VTACLRPDGTPALALTEVEVSDEERAEGIHYLRAEAQLAARGYEEPMVHFGDREAPPFIQLPPELEKLFVVLEHDLPDREQLGRIAQELTADRPEDLPQGDDLARLLDAAAGLTRSEAEGAFAPSLVRHGAGVPQEKWTLS
jgi:hypothetical protein